MSSHTSLVFGFPITGSHAFTQVKKDGAFIQDGTVEDWLDVLAKAHGITVVANPRRDFSQQDLTEDEECEREREKRYEQYTAQVSKLRSEQYGDCAVSAQGCQWYNPTFVVVALRPNLSEKRDGCLRPLPDLVVKPEVIDQLKRFCQVMGIEYQEPQWFLSESWDLD